MREEDSQLRAAFFSLTVSEQHELLTAMLCHARELPDTIVSAEQLADLADNLLQVLNGETSADDDLDSQ